MRPVTATRRESSAFRGCSDISSTIARTFSSISPTAHGVPFEQHGVGIADVDRSGRTGREAQSYPLVVHGVAPFRAQKTRP